MEWKKKISTTLPSGTDRHVNLKPSSKLCLSSYIRFLLHYFNSSFTSFYPFNIR